MLMRLLVALSSAWPERWAMAFGEALGAAAWALGVRRRVVRENLARAFPEMTEAARRALCRAHYAHLGRSAVEFFRAPRWSKEMLQARIDPGDWAVLERAQAQGRGVIACVAHLGNFELLAGYAARRGVPLTAVTRQLRGAFNRAWMSLRGELGVRELRGKNVVGKMVEVLRADQVLAVIVDQNMLPRRAVFVPFFGTLAATTPAPAVLAERTGAPVILAAMFRQPNGRFRVHVQGPFELGHGPARTTQLLEELNGALEAMIRLHPAQWFWVHRRWKTRPEP